MCEVGGGGGLAVGEWSFMGLEPGPRAPIYLFFLLWMFLGVGIIADIFMAAIEVITSKEKMIKGPDGQDVPVKVWNATVANLTLMALGSSAPEILLSIIEIVGASFFSGDLGPSTIVGSAAFNLFIIMAVCVTALPEGETRKIADMGVFKITATFSIFAYVWLFIILVVITPNIVHFGEALLTFLYFPLLVGLAFAADKGWFSGKGGRVVPDSHVIQIGGTHYKPGEAVELLKKIDTNGLSDDETAELLASLAQTKQAKPSRAQLRMQAVRSMTGQKRVVPPPPSAATMAKLKYKTTADSGGGAPPPPPRVFWGDTSGAICTKYAVLESCELVTLLLLRDPPTGSLTVRYETVDGTAKGGADDRAPGVKSKFDFEAQKGELHFADGEHYKQVQVKIFDDEDVEDDEDFSVVVSPVMGAADDALDLSGGSTATVTIIDDDEPGEVGFAVDDVNLTVVETAGFASVPVSRMNGSAGAIIVKYATVDGTAAADRDFTPQTGELEFGPGELRKEIRVPIVDAAHYEKDATFELALTYKAGPPRGALSERATCRVQIVSDDKAKALADKVAALVNANADKYSVGTSSWGQQFKDALTIEGGDDEDGEGGAPGTVAKVLHYLTLPFKLIFAFVPPTDYGGGWVCFCVALIFIGGVTTLIGDLAALFGCCAGLEPSVTAITLVALGTSLPDTFASKAAAIGDDTADAAVGNVTGSNGVNVFLGLGLPWTIAALYWEHLAGAGAKADWREAYGHFDTATKEWKNGRVIERFAFENVGSLGNKVTYNSVTGEAGDDTYGFAVDADGLGGSVGVFCFCALVCIGMLYYRRVVHGAELGGPAGPAKLHAGIFVLLWLIYVVYSTVMAYANLGDC